MFLKQGVRGRLLLFTALLCICSMIAAGCAASKDTYGRVGEIAPGSDFLGSSNEGAPPDTAGPLPGEQRKGLRFVIRTGSLELIIVDARKSAEEIGQLATAAGGIISESQLYEVGSGQYAAELSLRIPESRFDSFIAQLEELGEATDIRKASEDVTLTYLDLETRIKNLKAEEERLREILTEAKTVEDILKVEQELFRVRGESEAMTAQFTHLQDQVAFSTIRIFLREKPSAGQSISQKPFANLGERLKEAFFQSINFISSATAFILVALTALLPVLVIVALIIVAVVALRRALRRRKSPPGGHSPDL